MVVQKTCSSPAETLGVQKYNIYTPYQVRLCLVSDIVNISYFMLLKVSYLMCSYIGLDWSIDLFLANESSKQILWNQNGFYSD